MSQYKYDTFRIASSFLAARKWPTEFFGYQTARRNNSGSNPLTPPCLTDYQAKDMALLNESAEMKRFDVRVVSKNLERGVISPEELAKALKSLPDDASNAEWVSLEALEAIKDPDDKSENNPGPNGKLPHAS